MTEKQLKEICKEYGWEVTISEDKKKVTLTHPYSIAQMGSLTLSYNVVYLDDIWSPLYDDAEDEDIDEAAIKIWEGNAQLEIKDIIESLYEMNCKVTYLAEAIEPYCVTYYSIKKIVEETPLLIEIVGESQYRLTYGTSLLGLTFVDTVFFQCESPVDFVKALNKKFDEFDVTYKAISYWRGNNEALRENEIHLFDVIKAFEAFKGEIEMLLKRF